MNLSFKLIKKVAKWSHIVALHKLESNQMIKMSKLTDIAAFPKPIERQKVSTCLKVFCEEKVCLKMLSRLEKC